jgi:hypothetical protein
MADLEEGDPIEWWLHRRLILSSEQCRGFDSLVLLVSWEVWKERNARIFRNEVSTPAVVA